MIKSIKNLNRKFKLTGISTPYFGVSWENIDDTEQLKKYLKELYIFRNKLAYFAFLYDTLYSQLIMDDVGEDEIPEEIAKKIGWQAFDTYSEIEEMLFSSDYLFLLEKEQREEIIEQFDEVKMKRAEMDSSEDEFVEYEELAEKMIRLVILFQDLEKEIEKLEPKAIK